MEPELIANTATVSMDSLLAQLGNVVDAFRLGALPGLAAALTLMLGVLNFGPLKTRLAASSLDWIKPLLTLVGMIGGAIVGALIAGQATVDSILIGLGVLFSGGGPVVAQLVRDIRD